MKAEGVPTEIIAITAVLTPDEEIGAVCEGGEDSGRA